MVAELADLAGLVHDAQDPVDDTNRAGAEVGVARTSGDLGGDHRIVEVERMVVNEDVQAGAIAAADLEPIDRRQGLVDRQASLEEPVCIPPLLRRLTTSAARSRSRVIAHTPSRTAIRAWLRASSWLVESVPSCSSRSSCSTAARSSSQCTSAGPRLGSARRRR